MQSHHAMLKELLVAYSCLVFWSFGLYEYVPPEFLLRAFSPNGAPKIRVSIKWNHCFYESNVFKDIMLKTKQLSIKSEGHTVLFISMK